MIGNEGAGVALESVGPERIFSDDFLGVGPIYEYKSRKSIILVPESL